MMDELTYSTNLHLATRKTLQCLDFALQGKDSQEGAAAPYRLTPADLLVVRAHLAAITNVVGGARLVPVAKVRTERGYRKAART